MSRQQRIETTLTQRFNPQFLLVENESHRHHVPENSETHFKVTLVSDLFHAMNRVDRHRKVNQLLNDELSSGLHALSLHLFTTEEWTKRQQKTKPSPACRDGFDA